MFTELKGLSCGGNVLDLAVGIIIEQRLEKLFILLGRYFNSTFKFTLGKVDFSNLFFVLNGDAYATLEEAKKAGALPRSITASF